jgi:peroxiredoxin/uncharacterized membrane protein YeaQ/YmgE (transglycosylase-associated protein family)
LDVEDLAPDFTLFEFGSQDPVSLHDFEGSVILLDFFAYWCGHCVTAASELEPEIDAYYRQQGGNPDGLPVQLLAISADSRDPAAVQSFIDTHNLPLVLDDVDRAVFGAHADGYLPHLTIVNGAASTNYDQWEILYSRAGYSEGDYTTLRSIIDGVERLPELQAGDANQDLQFDQLDLFQVLRARKYLSGQAATWGEGDWNGAPGGTIGDPPPGDGLFNSLDVIQALGAKTWLQGPYAGLAPDGEGGDEQVSIGYDADSGEIWLDAPASTPLTSLLIESASAVFTGDAAQNLGGSFDVDDDDTVFKATFGSSFGSLSFGSVAPQGLSQQFLLDDLGVIGSFVGGGALGEVDLIYVPVPEPSTVVYALLGAVVLLGCQRRNRTTTPPERGAMKASGR